MGPARPLLTTRFRFVFVGLLLVNTDAIVLDDPKPAENLYIAALQGRSKGMHELRELLCSGPGVRSQHGDASVLRRTEPNGIREVEVQRDQATTLVSARGDERGIGRRCHRLVSNRRDIVTRRAENGGATLPEILVKLEFHALCFVGKST